jgi:hypothetical protein
MAELANIIHSATAVLRKDIHRLHPFALQSKPALLAMAAISTPRIRRTIMPTAKSPEAILAFIRFFEGVSKVCIRDPISRTGRVLRSRLPA